MTDTTEETAYDRLVAFARAAYAAIESEYERYAPPGIYATTRRPAERELFEVHAKHYLEWQEDVDTEPWLVACGLDSTWSYLRRTAYMLSGDPDLPADFDRSGYDPSWGNPLIVTLH